MASPKPRDEDLDFFGMTHQGLKRKENQDAFLFSTLHKTMRVRGTNLPNPELLEMPTQRLASFGMVADGVGGRAGGERASRAAIETVVNYVTHALDAFYTHDATNEEPFLDSLREAAWLTHDAVQDAAAKGGEERGPATTLTLMIAIWPHLYLLHVGDSRCYRYRHGVLTQLTRDQTMAQDLVDQGALPQERAALSPFSHILSSSLGGPMTRPDVLRSDLERGDVIVLCSDGLTNHVPDAAIATRIQDMTSSESACRALVQDALDDGGTDNVTVLVLRAIVRGEE